MWIKINTRRLAPQMAIAWNLGFGNPFEKHFGTSISRTLQHFNGKSTDYFVDAKEYGKFNAQLERLINRGGFLKTACPKARQFLEMAETWSERSFSGDLQGISNRGLSKLFRKFVLEMQPSFYARMWMVYRISHPLEAAIEKKLQETTNNKGKTARLLNIFSFPLGLSNIQEERMDALKIASLRGKVGKGEFEELIEAHTEKFTHMPMYGFDHEPFSKAHFQGEISRIREPRKELRELAAAYESRKGKYERAILELRPTRSLAALLEFYSEMIHLRDYRDMLRQKVNFHARRLYLEIGRRAHLGIEETNLLTNDEIVKFLENGKAPTIKVIRNRRKEWLIIQDGEEVKIFGGTEAARIARLELGNSNRQGTGCLMGRAGSKGAATGPARIVNTNKDLMKIRRGDVMVTSMTRQDFVPYLRRCAALVTDEGGITSHAAITCRELKIPCIVGTEIATVTFHDGELLEVDSKKGQVRIIEV
ncbi:MAG: PEP-utilizing enzyme [Candidatus Micrarchaeota archaeon]